MARTLRLGMLTPSSNTALEPLTQAMLAPLPETSAHFSRFRVTEIGLGDIAPRQFDDAPILRAAELLADAKADVIAWNGTFSGWLGFAEVPPERIEAAVAEIAPSRPDAIAIVCTNLRAVQLA
jgi:maleate isomerase